MVESTGEYVCFIDADDFVDSNYVYYLLYVCIEYDCDISQCEYILTDGEKGTVNTEDTNVKIYTNIQMLHNLYNEQYVKTVIVCNKLFKKQLFRDVSFPVDRIHEDEATTYKLIYAAKRIGTLNNSLYYYYQRANSIMNSGFSIRKLDILWSIDQRRCFYRDKQLESLYYKDCNRLLFKILKMYYEISNSKQIKNKKSTRKI